MLYTFARLLQFAGLLILPVAMAGQVEDRFGVREMLTLAAIGIGVFVLGWLLQQAARPK